MFWNNTNRDIRLKTIKYRNEYCTYIPQIKFPKVASLFHCSNIHSCAKLKYQIDSYIQKGCRKPKRTSDSKLTLTLTVPSGTIISVYFLEMTFVLEYTEFKCFCGSFLLNSADIKSEMQFFHREYLWVEPNQKINQNQLFHGRVHFRHPTFLVCSKCNRVVGNVIFPYVLRQKILRFSKWRLISTTFFLVKENEKFKIVKKN